MVNRSVNGTLDTTPVHEGRRSGRRSGSLGTRDRSTDRRLDLGNDQSHSISNVKLLPEPCTVWQRLSQMSKPFAAASPLPNPVAVV